MEAKDAGDALLRGTELLEPPAREAAAARRARGEVHRGQAAAVLAGWRCSLEVIEVPQEGGSAGIAFDVSQLEGARLDLQQATQAHARTLDQLSTAVAIFDRRKQLVFHNTAYRQLWSLDAAFLEGGPSESEILDHLRVRHLLPEQADFRSWKEAHLAGYQSLDTSEQVWHLPDGRTLRAVINPSQQNGVTYLFDDVTAQFHLESRFNAQARVQGEDAGHAEGGRRRVRHRRAPETVERRLRRAVAAGAQGARRQAPHRPRRHTLRAAVARRRAVGHAAHGGGRPARPAHRAGAAAHLPRRHHHRLHRRPAAGRGDPADLHRHHRQP